MVITEPPIRVLLAGDEPDLGELLEKYLASRGFRLTRVTDGRSALRALRSQPFDVAVLGIALADIDGLEVLRQARAEPTPPECIVATGAGTLDMVIAAMRLGAYDVLARPYHLPAVESLVRRASEKRRLAADNRWLTSRLSKLDAVPEIHTLHAPLQAVLALAGRAAATDVPLLIRGEPGTGKAAMARTLHRASPRAAGPFVELAAAMVAPERQATELFGMERGARGASGAGLAEQAAGGTLFVSDVEQLELGVQAQLADAVKNRRYKRVGASRRLEFDARVMAATASDPSRDARSGRLRGELGAAFSSVVLALPPLRDRRVDIPLLAEKFLRDLGAQAAGLSADAIDALQRYDWPGNLQELRNVLERGVLLAGGGVIERGHLALPGTTAAGPGAVQAGDELLTLAAVERRHIEAMLVRAGWAQGRTAKLLGISVKTLYRKIREYGLQRPGARS